MAARTLLITIFTLLEYSLSSKVIKIGVILPMSGDYPFSMPGTVPVLQLAVDTIDFLPEHKIELVLRDSECSETAGPLAAIDLHKEEHAHVFIGPACDYALAPVARFSFKWGVPVLTAGALVTAFNDKFQYQLLTRLMGSYTNVGDFFLEVMEQFNWTHIGLVYNDHKSRPNKGKSNCFFAMEAIYLAIKNKHSYTPWHISVDINQPNLDIKDVFDKARHEARILVLCAPTDHVREIVIAAHDQSDTGEYVFFNIDLFTRYDGSENMWYRKEDPPEKNAKARKAYEALMTVTVRKPTSPEYQIFSEEVKRRGKAMYANFKFEDQVNSFVGAFHDAVILYALAVKEALIAGENITDGAAITKRMWNRTFEGITGTVSIDDNGDRNMDYSLLDMDPNTGVFEVVGNYYGNRKRYEVVPGKLIHWAGGRSTPPPDVPKCGFDGAKCASSEDSSEATEFPKYGIVLIVLGSLLVCAGVVIFLLYRWKFGNYFTMSPDTKMT